MSTRPEDQAGVALQVLRIPIVHIEPEVGHGTSVSSVLARGGTDGQLPTTRDETAIWLGYLHQARGSGGVVVVDIDVNGVGTETQ